MTEKRITGTKEWATSTENIQYGCENDCLYCYAKAMAVRHKKIDIEKWNQPEIKEDRLARAINRRKGTIMFPSTHDITPHNLPEAKYFLHKLLAPGNRVLVVSKPRLDCIKSICDEFAFKYFRDRNQILFRFTIGSWDDDILSVWEPGAPNFFERYSSLKYAFENGYKTSVSMEPMLDRQPWKTIIQVKQFVTDAIWLGKMNDWRRRISTNGHDINKIHPDLTSDIEYWERDENIFKLYEMHHNDPLIRWKESIKKVIGLKLAEQPGMDI